MTVRPSAEAAEHAEHRQDQHRRRPAYDIALRDGAHLGKIAEFSRAGQSLAA